jgi:superfamily II DNA or RNA helicase
VASAFEVDEEESENEESRAERKEYKEENSQYGIEWEPEVLRQNALSGDYASPETTMQASKDLGLGSLCSTLDLKDYQCGPATWMVEHPNQKGLLCFYGTGFGKTFTAVGVAKALFKAGMIHRCLIVTPAPLVENMRKAFRTCDGEAGYSGSLLRSTTKDTGAQVTVVGKEALLNFKKTLQSAIEDMHKAETLLIVDEAHNFRNGDKAMANRLRILALAADYVLLLSATPMFNKPEDIMVLLDMLEWRFQDQRWFTKTPPEALDDDVLRKKAERRVAIPSQDTIDLMLEENFPTFEEHIETVELDDDQMTALREEASAYRQEREAAERRVQKRPGRKKRKRVISNDDDEEALEAGNKYFVQSRQHALMAPDKKMSPKFEKMIEFMEEDGWPKALVFIEYVECSGGVRTIAQMLQNTCRGKGKNVTVQSIFGEVDQVTRVNLVDRFNKDSSHEDSIGILVMSAAGNEGLDFKGVRHVHLMNMDWNPGRVDQKIGRGIRFKSHKHLPVAEQKVMVYRYLAIPRDILDAISEGGEISTQKCRDYLPGSPMEDLTKVELYLFVREMEKRTRIEECTQILQEEDIAIPLQCKPSREPIMAPDHGHQSYLKIIDSGGLKPPGDQVPPSIRILRRNAELRSAKAAYFRPLRQGAGAGASTGAGAGASASTGAGASLDLDLGAGAGASASASTGAGASLDLGAGAGVVAGAGAGAGVVATMGRGAGSGASLGLGAGAGGAGGAGGASLGVGVSVGTSTSVDGSESDESTRESGSDDDDDDYDDVSLDSEDSTR